MFLSLTITNCSALTVYADNSKNKSIPTYPNSYDIKWYNLKRETATQLDFKINEKYPSLIVTHYYKDHFLKKGWQKCKQNSDEWITYLENNKGREIKITQNMNQFIKKLDQKLLLVALRYRSDKDNYNPQNLITQAVTVVLYDVKNKEEFNIIVSSNCN